MARGRHRVERHARCVAAKQERVGQERALRIPAGSDGIGPDVLDEVDQLELVDRRDRVRPMGGRGHEPIVAGGHQGVEDGHCPRR